MARADISDGMSNGGSGILEGGLVLLAGMAVLACGWTVWRQRLRLRWPRAASGRGGGTQLREERELQAGLVDVCERVDSALDRFERQSEARMSRLRELLKEADKRISRLEVLAQNGRQKPSGQRPRRGDAHEVAATDELPGGASSRPASSVQQEVSGRCAESEIGGVADAPVLVQRIYELADQGLSGIKIAEAIHAPLGEVELALNLRRFAATAG